MSAAAEAAPLTEPFDPDRGWRLHSQVSVRPEKFGALLYHFGTRKLSFLKNHTMVTLVKSLADHPDARAACRAAGVDPAHESAYLKALKVLADSTILVPAEPMEAP
ncbi:mycofactocin biosynthesis chaperone MftB [Mycolicibacter acidiphilus]|uniref:mycofactocin biosynthesis chaperone MftB n=1 Tax=Mycolicibacter acidiphilus TaxID=2835306 RepID=UPI0027DD91AF|nr:mycofactocin biosynthesis chaperone MftB [Mycolicibacter acidiphilus]